jgi:hypothetical protein
MKINIGKKHFWIAVSALIIGTIIAVVLIMFLPFNFKPTGTDEEIRTEMINRIETVSEIRNEISFVSITPFMWDEGYYIDSTIDEAMLKETVGMNIDYQELSVTDQRLIFYYNGQKTADIIFGKDEIDFDIKAGVIDPEDAWMDIVKNPNGSIRLVEESLLSCLPSPRFSQALAGSWNA